jgi:hypothetical protein
MEHRTSNRPSDEVPFLADEEKVVFATSRRLSRRAKWAHLLPYSGVLNITLILVLLSTWILQRHESSRAYIPDEIYCKQLCAFSITSSLIRQKHPHNLLLNIKQLFSAVVFKATSRNLKALQARLTPTGMNFTTVSFTSCMPSFQIVKANHSVSL